MHPYLKRFQQELCLRGRAPRTILNYSYHLRDFLAWLPCQPSELNLRLVRRYQEHLAFERRLAWPSYNVAVCALRFFFRSVLGRAWTPYQVPLRRTPPKLPRVLSRAELSRLLASCQHSPRLLALVGTLYGTGIRLSELRFIRLGDIDHEQRTITIQAGKGGRPRLVPLSLGLQAVLSRYIATLGDQGKDAWLLPAPGGTHPLAACTIRTALGRGARQAGIGSTVTPHVFRHSLATHLLEDGAPLPAIQSLLGHRSLQTTLRYLQVSLSYLSGLRSPLDALLPAEPRRDDLVPLPER